MTYCGLTEERSKICTENLWETCWGCWIGSLAAISGCDEAGIWLLLELRGCEQAEVVTYLQEAMTKYEVAKITLHP